MKPPTKPKARTTPAAGVSAVSAVQNPVLSTAAPTEPAQITPPRATGSASSRSLPTWVLPSVRSTVHVVPPTPAPTKKRQAEQRAPGPGLQSPPSKKQQTEPRVSDLLQQADKDLQQIQLRTSQIARLRKDIGVLHSAAEVTARDSDEIIRGLSREIYDLRGALQFAHLQEARSQGASQALKLQRYPEQLADDYKISYAVSLLRDTAAQWWMLRTKANSGEQAIHSFEGFKAALSKKFVPVNAKEQAREKLAYLTQTGDLQVYVEQFENLSLQIDDLSAAEGMDKLCRGLKPEHQIWVKTYGVSTLEEAVNLAHKVSAFSSASQTMTPPPYRAPIDAMDIDVMHMNALTGRSPKDKRELYHEHVQELVSFPPVHDRPLTPGPQRPQRDYQSQSRQGNHPSPGRQGNYPSYGRQGNYPSQSRQGNYPSPGLDRFCSTNDCKDEDEVSTSKSATSPGTGNQSDHLVSLASQHQDPDQPEKLLLFQGSISGIKCTILVDGGATNNFISERFRKQAKLATVEITSPMSVAMGDGTTHAVPRKIPGAHIQIDDFKDTIPLCETSLTSTFDIVLGKPWLRKHNPTINWREDVISLTSHGRWYELDGHRHRFLLDTSLTPPEGVEMLSALQMRKCVRRNDALLAIVNPVAATEELHAMGYEPVPGKLDPIKSHLTPANHEKLEVLVHEFADTRPDALPNGLPPERAVEHAIDEEPGSRPGSKAPYRMSPEDMELPLAKPCYILSAMFSLGRMGRYSGRPQVVEA
eukprot:gene30257-35245_t